VLRDNVRRMPGTLITNLTHFLDERGCIAPMEGPARRLAEFLTGIVAAMTHDMDEPALPTRCRRRPGRKPCPGILDTQFGGDFEDLAILWRCPECGDHGMITHWQNTFWDLM
jgi:hypothetical protein